MTLSRPSQWDGGFVFQHLAPPLFFGYQSVEIVKRQFAFIAQPEKAILDLAHLTQGSDNKAYRTQLRLQNLERLELKRLSVVQEKSVGLIQSGRVPPETYTPQYGMKGPIRQLFAGLLRLS